MFLEVFDQTVGLFTFRKNVKKQNKTWQSRKQWVLKKGGLFGVSIAHIKSDKDSFFLRPGLGIPATQTNGNSATLLTHRQKIHFMWQYLILNMCHMCKNYPHILVGAQPSPCCCPSFNRRKFRSLTSDNMDS